MMNIAAELKDLEIYHTHRIRFFSSFRTNARKDNSTANLASLLYDLNRNLTQRPSKAVAYLTFLKDLNNLIIKEAVSERDSFWGDLRHSSLFMRMINLEEAAMRDLLSLGALREFKIGYNLTISRMYHQNITDNYGTIGAAGRIAIDEVPESIAILLRNAVKQTQNEQLSHLEVEIRSRLAQPKSEGCCL